MESEEPLETIRPVVVGTQFYILGLLMAALWAFMGGSVLYLCVSAFAWLFDLESWDGASEYGWWFVFILFEFPVFLYLIYKEMVIEPVKATYDIYADRLEYSEGGGEFCRGMVLFEQVSGIQMASGLLQRRCDAGTIVLRSNQPFAEGDGVINDKIYKLVNVPYPQKVFQLLVDLVSGISGEEST